VFNSFVSGRSPQTVHEAVAVSDQDPNVSKDDEVQFDPVVVSPETARVLREEQALRRRRVVRSSAASGNGEVLATPAVRAAPPLAGKFCRCKAACSRCKCVERNVQCSSKCSCTCLE